MGGADWGCWTRYRVDLSEALAAAQREVFERGDYHKPDADTTFLDDIGLFEADRDQQETLLSEYGLYPLRPLIAEVGVDGLTQHLQALNEAPALDRLEDVRALNCLSIDGTRSVIDVTRVADAPALGAVAPLARDELTRLYGTAEPTRAQVEANQQFYEAIGRGQGVYIVAYQDGVPSEVFFGGYSYD